MRRFLVRFISIESLSSLLLLIAIGAAFLAANTVFRPVYEAVLAQPLLMHFDTRFFINDGLMAIFFLLIGLEIKREMREGTLSTLKHATLPLLGAAGGVLLPAGIFMAFNYNLPTARGWAIPTATDIAFSLAALNLFRKSLPPSLTIFLMALAVIDDLAAILIIAFFYSQQLALLPLLGGVGLILSLYILNHRQIAVLWPYLLMGMGLWLALLGAGIHPTLAGVVTGLAVPHKIGAVFPAKNLIRRLHTSVACIIVPLFAFANAGVSLAVVSSEHLFSPVALGIILGLVIGKPVGISLACYAGIQAKLAKLPTSATMPELIAVAMLAGIGFTMSLFIGMLAFTEADQLHMLRLSVVLGSLIAACGGIITLTVKRRLNN